MPRTKDSTRPLSSTFPNTYDIYNDYGKRQSIKVSDNEAILTDIEKFLIEQNGKSKMIHKQKSNGIIITNISNENRTRNKNSDKYNAITNIDQSSKQKPVLYPNFNRYNRENIIHETNYKYHSTFTPNRLCRWSSLSPILPKRIYDEGNSIDKPYDAYVAAIIDRIYENFNKRNEQKSDESKSSSRTCSYQVSTRQTIHEKIYSTINEKKLCLRIAVNGASKSLRGSLPLTNSNLNSGDFGDDAGMISENQDFCFLGLADGASGNRSLGLNPADFSRAILATCRNIFHQNNLQPKQFPQLIMSAIQKIQASEIRGSSTLCLIALNKQEHILTSLNIGDSGFIIYRNNEIYRRSTCTMNSDGCGPRQLFALNSTYGLPCFINEKEVLQNCSVDNFKVQKGDIIILSSDGLWDVMKSDQLQQIIERNANNHLQNLANDLLNEAIDGYIISRDDILVIVCRVDEL